MEFERQKLIQQFKTELDVPQAEEEGQEEEKKAESKEGEPMVYIDYKWVKIMFQDRPYFHKINGNSLLLDKLPKGFSVYGHHCDSLESCVNG